MAVIRAWEAGMELTLGAFGDERLEKDPMRVDGGLTW
jgi:hypothetical protein